MAVNLVYVASPLATSASSFLAQRASRKFGRIHVTILCKVTGFSFIFFEVVLGRCTCGGVSLFNRKNKLQQQKVILPRAAVFPLPDHCTCMAIPGGGCGAALPAVLPVHACPTGALDRAGARLDPPHSDYELYKAINTLCHHGQRT